MLPAHSPTWGSVLRTMRSRPQTKPTFRCLTDWAHPVPCKYSILYGVSTSRVLLNFWQKHSASISKPVFYWKLSNLSWILHKISSDNMFSLWNFKTVQYFSRKCNSLNLDSTWTKELLNRNMLMTRNFPSKIVHIF